MIVQVNVVVVLDHVQEHVQQLVLVIAPVNAVAVPELAARAVCIPAALHAQEPARILA
jgi:hypothetical protein